MNKAAQDMAFLANKKLKEKYTPEQLRKLKQKAVNARWGKYYHRKAQEQKKKPTI